MIIRSSLAASLVALSCAAPAIALNPQPEPPGRAAHVSGIVLVALNPQPEPPGDPPLKFRAFVTTNGVVRAAPGENVALNPQPEPPGIVAFDARRLLPPGPCRTIVVTVKVEGVRRSFTAHAANSAETGRCAYKVPTPGAKAGSRAAVTFSRER